MPPPTAQNVGVLEVRREGFSQVAAARVAVAGSHPAADGKVPPTAPDHDPSADRPWHALPASDVAAELAVDPDAGLARDEVARRRERWGPNELPESAGRSLLVIVLHQFKSPLIYLLLGAAIVALALGETSDSIVIAVVVLVNAVIGAYQEGRAERAINALRRMAGQRAQVIRDGREEVVDARDVVPGDVLALAAGDAVAADARLVDGASLQVAEAALTGESMPVGKDVEPVEHDAALADRRSMTYAGTHVTGGRGRAVVVATGVASEIGRIASMAGTSRPPRTPLERRIDQFGRYVMIAAIGLFALILAIGLVRDVRFGEIIMIGISQVVGLIPEGLPVAMTIALAVGVQRMARRGAIVRRLSAVETLGSTTVICSDKTGTLTRNEMTVTAIVLPDGRELEATGIGYAPDGEVRDGDRAVDAGADDPLRALLEAAILCNDAALLGPDDDDARWRPVGDPTEAALVTLAMKAGLDPDELRARSPRHAELPFDAAAKLMATEHDGGVYIKGAPEVMLELCDLDDAARDAARDAAARLADRALRVLAIARVDGGEIDDRAGADAFRGRATLLGQVGELDPPRPEVADAVARCRGAGIRPVMVTGDHKATAVAVAHTLGIAAAGDRAVDGPELQRMSDDELARQIGEVAVFARVHPAQKLRIVRAYQAQHDVVAMTGDGVNDAPALVRADVGVAMGITGTEVAKEAAKIVVTDDNFASIVSAVEEGRVAYRNIKKVVLFLVATSLAEVLVLLLAMLLGYPPPFAAVQILWNNLVTEGVITVNLIMDPPEGDEMKRRPIARGEPLLTRALVTRLGFMTPAIVASTLGWFIYRIESGVPFAVAQTETFTLLAICEWYNVLNCRSETRSALNLGILRNKWLVGGLVVGNLLQFGVVFGPLHHVFHTVPFGWEQVVELAVVGSLVLWVEELRKLVARLRRRRRAPARRAAEAAA
jgi:magnesium-transporting ATPase (P-type)